MPLRFPPHETSVRDWNSGSGDGVQPPQCAVAQPCGLRRQFLLPKELQEGVAGGFDTGGVRRQVTGGADDQIGAARHAAARFFVAGVAAGTEEFGDAELGIHVLAEAAEVGILAQKAGEASAGGMVLGPEVGRDAAVG